MSEKQQFSTFYVDHLLFGVEVEKVHEVLGYQKITRVPLAGKVVRGLINLRGQIVTAIDLRRCLELPEAPNNRLLMNVVVRTEDGAVSLLVDDIGDVVETEKETFERPPDTLDAPARRMILGVHKLHDRLMHVLDTDEIICGNLAYQERVEGV